MNLANPPTFSDRDVRQRGLVPPERLAACHGLVIGVGAIGRQVALQLAALGVSRLTLFDNDRVEVVNLAPQGYWPDDVQCAKVHATAALCERILPSMRVQACHERFKRSTPANFAIEGDLAVFACVDSIQTRRVIWESIRHRTEFFIDGRMSAETIRIVTAGAPAVDRYYATTLFAAEQAHHGPCTARSTIYTASIAAGLMVGQFTKWLRGLPTDDDVTVNLLAMELTTSNHS